MPLSHVTFSFGAPERTLLLVDQFPGDIIAFYEGLVDRTPVVRVVYDDSAVPFRDIGRYFAERYQPTLKYSGSVKECMFVADQASHRTAVIAVRRLWPFDEPPIVVYRTDPFVLSHTVSESQRESYHEFYDSLNHPDGDTATKDNGTGVALHSRQACAQ